MKKLKTKKSAQSYETITAEDSFGLGVKLTVLRSGHKSLRRANRLSTAVAAELKRDEANLLKDHASREENAEALDGAHKAHAEYAKSVTAARKVGSNFKNNSTSQSERDHSTLYANSLEYRAAYDDLQEKYEPKLIEADQLDSCFKVTKWEGPAFDKTEKWTGKEDPETVRSILFDDLDDLGLVPEFLTLTGEEIEEGSDLEKTALELYLKHEEDLTELTTAYNAMLVGLREAPDFSDDDEERFNYHTPVRQALEAMNHEPTNRPFGYFKLRCLEGVPQRHAANVTDTAADIYAKCVSLKQIKEDIAADYDKALEAAGLKTTGTFGIDTRSKFAGYSYPLAFSLWIAELSHQAQRAFEKKSRRGAS